MSDLVVNDGGGDDDGGDGRDGGCCGCSRSNSIGSDEFVVMRTMRTMWSSGGTRRRFAPVRPLVATGSRRIGRRIRRSGGMRGHVLR